MFKFTIHNIVRHVLHSIDIFSFALIDKYANSLISRILKYVARSYSRWHRVTLAASLFGLPWRLTNGGLRRGYKWRHPYVHVTTRVGKRHFDSTLMNRSTMTEYKTTVSRYYDYFIRAHVPYITLRQLSLTYSSQRNFLTLYLKTNCLEDSYKNFDEVFVREILTKRFSKNCLRRRLPLTKRTYGCSIGYRAGKRRKNGNSTCDWRV